MENTLKGSEFIYNHPEERAKDLMNAFKDPSIKGIFSCIGGYEFLQGEGKIQGRLIGGCMDVLEMAKGTEIWPDKEKFKDSILFFETSEDKIPSANLGYWLRNYAALGILKEEEGLKDMPIIYDMNFGHTSSIITIPYGAMAEINCDDKTFSILESGVTEK